MNHAPSSDGRLEQPAIPAPRQIEPEHRERAAFVYDELLIIERCRVLARPEVKEIFVDFLSSILDKLDQVQDEEGPPHIQEQLDKLTTTFDTIDPAYKPLDDLSDQELSVYSSLEHAMRSRQGSVDDYRSMVEEFRRLRDGLENNDSHTIYEFVESQIRAAEKKSPVSLPTIVRPFLMLQNFFSWRKLDAELKSACEQIAHGGEQKKVLLPRCQEKLAYALAQSDDDNFSEALQLARVARVETAREHFPTRDEYLKHFDRVNHDLIEGLDRMIGVMNSGWITKFFASLIFDQDLRAFAVGMILVNRAQNVLLADQIYGK